MKNASELLKRLTDCGYGNDKELNKLLDDCSEFIMRVEDDEESNAQHLQSEVAELRKERDELLQENRMLLEAYAVELEHRLSVQVPSPAAKGYGLEYLQHKREQSHAAVVDYRIYLNWCKELIAALKRLSFAAQTTGGTSGRDDELVAAIGQAESALSIVACSRAIDAVQPAPTSTGVPGEIKRAIRSARTAMNMWENGYAFDTHGKSRDIQRDIEIADALLSARPTSEATTPPAAQEE